MQALFLLALVLPIQSGESMRLCRSVSSAKRKALKQTTLSFSKKPNTALGPSPAADADEEDPIVMSEEQEVIID